MPTPFPELAELHSSGLLLVLIHLVQFKSRLLGQTATTAVTVLNPMPIVSQVDSATIVELSGPMTVIGSGFVAGSQVVVSGTPIKTVFIDSNHLSTSVLVSSDKATSLSLEVSNPGPGAVTGAPFTVPVSIPSLVISPQILYGGNVTITASIPGVPANSILTLDGVPLTTLTMDADSVAATGYLPFWHSGSASVAITTSDGDSAFAQSDIPMSSRAD